MACDKGERREKKKKKKERRRKKKEKKRRLYNFHLNLFKCAQGLRTQLCIRKQARTYKHGEYCDFPPLHPIPDVHVVNMDRVGGLDEVGRGGLLCSTYSKKKKKRKNPQNTRHPY